MLQGPYFKNALNVKSTITRLKTLSKTPLLFCIDQEGGRVNRIQIGVTPFPSAAEIGTFESPDYAYQMGFQLASELKALGINTLLGPVADVLINPENTVIGDRSFHTNPIVMTTLVNAYTKGIKDAGVLPVLKHFPGHGSSNADSHETLPKSDTSESILLHRELMPFLGSLNDTPLIMSGHLLFKSVDPRFPASLSSRWINEKLKTELHYKGLVMTDDIAMKALSLIAPPALLVKKALLAGNEFILMTYPLSQIETINLFLSRESTIDSAFNDILTSANTRISEFKKQYGTILH